MNYHIHLDPVNGAKVTKGPGECLVFFGPLDQCLSFIWADARQVEFIPGKFEIIEETPFAKEVLAESK